MPDSFVEMCLYCFHSCRSRRSATYGAASNLRRTGGHLFEGTNLEPLSIPMVWKALFADKLINKAKLTSTQQKMHFGYHGCGTFYAMQSQVSFFAPTTPMRVVEMFTNSNTTTPSTTALFLF